VNTPYRVRITAGSVTCTASLSPNRTARAIWNALPLIGSANRWGDEIYFEVPVDLAEDDGQEEVAVGDLAFWPPGSAICIFWGPTPASRGTEPRAASPVNVFGRIEGSVSELSKVAAGARVRIDQVSA
jgi:hypothetical protein